MENEKLNGLRRQMNQLDNQLLQILEAKFELAKDIGKIKKNSGSPVRGVDQEQEIMSSKSGRTWLPKDFVNSLFGLIFDASVKMQEEKNEEIRGARQDET